MPKPISLEATAPDDATIDLPLEEAFNNVIESLRRGSDDALSFELDVYETIFTQHQNRRPSEGAPESRGTAGPETGNGGCDPKPE